MKKFAGLKGVFTDYNEAKFCVLPVPYSTQNDWNPMANRGPEAIIEASQHIELYDTETRKQIWQKGIHTMEPLYNLNSDEKVCDSVEAKVNELFDMEKFPVVLGGNRTVCVGAARAACSKFNDISVVQFGAHNSMRVNYKGSEYSPECVMYHIQKIAPLVQIGIRAMGADGQRNSDMAKMFFARDLYFDNSNRWFNEVYDSLTKNIYITIDLTVFDPSIMPDVSVPEPGGLRYFTVLRIIKEIFRRSNVVGVDIVGLCPNNTNISSSFLAARLAYQIMTYKGVYNYGL